jgi:hypothetical protein
MLANVTRILANVLINFQTFWKNFIKFKKKKKVWLPSYDESCQESIICDYNKYLICNNDNSICVCNSTSYWAAELGKCGKFFIF